MTKTISELEEEIANQTPDDDNEVYGAPVEQPTPRQPVEDATPAPEPTPIQVAIAHSGFDVAKLFEAICGSQMAIGDRITAALDALDNELKDAHAAAAKQIADAQAELPSVPTAEWLTGAGRGAEVSAAEARRSQLLALIADGQAKHKVINADYWSRRSVIMHDAVRDSSVNVKSVDDLTKAVTGLMRDEAAPVFRSFRLIVDAAEAASQQTVAHGF